MQDFFINFFIFGRLHHYIKGMAFPFVQLFSYNCIFIRIMQKNMQLFVFGKIYGPFAALFRISGGGVCTAAFPLHAANDAVCPAPP